MKSLWLTRAAAVAALLAVLLTASAIPRSSVEAQSGRQPEKKKLEKKTDVQKGAEHPQDPVPPIPKDDKQEPSIKLSTQVVNVYVTVIDKKSGRLYTNLTKKNFTVYEDGVKQELTNFAPVEGPMTAVLLIENAYNNRYYRGSYFEPTFVQEIF